MYIKKSSSKWDFIDNRYRAFDILNINKVLLRNYGIKLALEKPIQDKYY